MAYSSCVGSKYRGGFSLLVPLYDDGIQFSTWRRANALAHDDGMFTLWTTPDGNVCMCVCMYVPHWHIAGDREMTWLGGESRVNCSA